MTEEPQVEETKEAKTPIPTVKDFLSQIEGTELTAKEIKYNATGIKYDKIICYISDRKYGISVWLTKEERTHQIKTTAQMNVFIARLLKYIENKKTEEQKKSTEQKNKKPKEEKKEEKKD